MARCVREHDAALVDLGGARFDAVLRLARVRGAGQRRGLLEGQAILDVMGEMAAQLQGLAGLGVVARRRARGRALVEHELVVREPRPGQRYLLTLVELELRRVWLVGWAEAERLVFSAKAKARVLVAAQLWPLSALAGGITEISGTGERCRCGSDSFIDTDLASHRREGVRTVRRDCAECGRFCDFSVWREPSDAQAGIPGGGDGRDGGAADGLPGATAGRRTAAAGAGVARAAAATDPRR